MDAAGRYDPALLPKLFEMGLMGIDVPEAYGGSGGSFFQACLAVEELSRADAAVGVLVDVQNTLVNNAIDRNGTPEQKAKYLTRTAKDTVASYCLSEAGSGSDAFAMQCRAVPQRRPLRPRRPQALDHERRRGRDLPRLRDRRPDRPATRGSRRSSSRRTIRASRSASGRASSASARARRARCCFENCRIPADRLLGPVGKGYKIAIETLNEGRIGIGAQMLGVGQAALDAARRLREGARPVRQALVRVPGDALPARRRRDATRGGAPPRLQRRAPAGRRAFRSSRRPRWRSCTPSEAAEKICAMAVEVFGGNGYSTEYPVEKYYRDVKIGKIYEGTSFMQLSTIAKSILDE